MNKIKKEINQLKEKGVKEYLKTRDIKIKLCGVVLLMLGSFIFGLIMAS
jgi:hypothetical protein